MLDLSGGFMTRVYLIRHGEAEGNLYRRAHGWYDGRITAKGRRQIAELAERFKNEHIDALYSSDLRRTQQTAGAITKYHDLKLKLEPRLREVNMGEWEDVPWGNLTHLYPRQMADFNDDPDSWHAPGAETFPQLKGRMLSVVLELAARHEGETIVCVSHGMAIRSLISLLLGVESKEIYRVPHGDNTSVALLEVENGEAKVAFYNDVSHLSPENSTFARQSWWKKTGTVDGNNLRFEPLNPNAEPELYKSLYAETWRAVHGSLEGFEPECYLAAAKRHFSACPDSILKAIKNGETIGVTELDPSRGENGDYGWISLCYVAESERRKLLGVQLIGHAVSVFRKMGRKKLRLCVYEGNTGAIAFYGEAGFKPVDETQGICGRLIIMEKDLEL